MKQCNTEELYNLYKKSLLNLIQAKVQDAQKAEDLLHDSFLKMQTCCEKNCICERPKSYLYRVVANTIFDFFKKRGKENVSFDTVKILKMETAEGLKETIDCDLMQCLPVFLEETSEDNRKAFELVDLQQKSQVEVAEELGIPLPTLKSRVQRTRKFLKEKLELCCPSYKSKCS